MGDPVEKDFTALLQVVAPTRYTWGACVCWWWEAAGCREAAFESDRGHVEFTALLQAGAGATVTMGDRYKCTCKRRKAGAEHSRLRTGLARTQEEFGWKPPQQRSRFDILPLLLQVGRSPGF